VWVVVDCGMALLHEASEGARQAWGWPLATASGSSLQPPLRPLLHTSTRDFNDAPCGELALEPKRELYIDGTFLQ
jgi:hypothetical protein